MLEFFRQPAHKVRHGEINQEYQANKQPGNQDDHGAGFAQPSFQSMIDPSAEASATNRGGHTTKTDIQQLEPGKQVEKDQPHSDNPFGGYSREPVHL